MKSQTQMFTNSPLGTVVAESRFGVETANFCVRPATLLSSDCGLHIPPRQVSGGAPAPPPGSPTHAPGRPPRTRAVRIVSQPRLSAGRTLVPACGLAQCALYCSHRLSSADTSGPPAPPCSLPCDPLEHWCCGHSGAVCPERQGCRQISIFCLLKKTDCSITFPFLFSIFAAFTRLTFWGARFLFFSQN